MAIDTDTGKQRKMDEEMEEKVNDNVESGNDEPHQINILDLSNEVLLKIFAELGHDDLQALFCQCKRIKLLVQPMLWEKRKDYLAILLPQILKSKRLIGQSEKYLKRVLRTNEDLTGLAYNLPMERTQNGNEKPKDWLAILLGLYNDQDYFELERCANELAEIAKVHCYRFGNMARSELEAAFQSIQISLSRSFNEDKRLSPETMQQMYKRVNFLIFEKFMHKYPGLSKFTSVHWPKEMADEQRNKLAMEYGTKNMAGSKRRRRTTQGRMYEMREKGKVDISGPRRKRNCSYSPFMLRARFLDLDLEDEEWDGSDW